MRDLPCAGVMTVPGFFGATYCVPLDRQERRNKPESSAAKLYCLHLQEPECKKQEREKTKPRPFFRRVIFRLGRVTP